MKAHTKETQAAINSASALDILKEGNKRFINKSPVERNLLEQVQDTQSGQYPFAVVLSCIDSRVPVETIFDQGIGDVFSARVAGNIVNADILGSIEYGCKVAGSKLVVVMGHTSCGAVKSAIDDTYTDSPLQLGNIRTLLSGIKPSVLAVTEPADIKERTSKNKAFFGNVVNKNVELTIANLRNDSPVLAQMESDGEIAIVGAVYDVASGAVNFL